MLNLLENIEPNNVLKDDRAPETEEDEEERERTREDDGLQYQRSGEC